MGQIIYRAYMVFRGSNISCSLAFTTERKVGLFRAKPSSDSMRRRVISRSFLENATPFSFAFLLFAVFAWEHVACRPRPTVGNLYGQPTMLPN